MTTVVELKISALNDSPWRFKIISTKDFDNLVSTIDTYGPDSINPITIAELDNRYYIVDGHARRDAFKEAGFDKIKCIKSHCVRNFNELRSWSFRLNRQGHYNPIELLNMVKEDVKDGSNLEQVASQYGIRPDYLDRLLKLNNLNSDAKVLIEKVLNVARKRYQFVLEQINVYHLSLVADLSSEKQLEVLEWIFHDVVYGPPNESIVSLPSIFEIVNMVEQKRAKSAQQVPPKTRSKYNKREANSDMKHLQFRCHCGRSYYVDIAQGKAYECGEEHDVIVRKEIEYEVGNRSIAHARRGISMQS